MFAVRASPLLALLASCAPAVDDTNPSENSSTPLPGSTTSSTPGTSSTAEPAGMETSVDSSSTGTDEPPFEDDHVLGDWVCENDGPSIYLRIDTYTSPQAVTGIACVRWNPGQTTAIADYRPCGDLSSHPVGEGPHLALFAQAEEDGESWVFSANLYYSTAAHTLSGQWTGPAPTRGEIECVPVPPPI